MDKEKPQFYSDEEIILNIPYNSTLSHFFDKENWDIKIYQSNGEKPFVKIRQKEIKTN